MTEVEKERIKSTARRASVDHPTCSVCSRYAIERDVDGLTTYEVGGCPMWQARRNNPYLRSILPDDWYCADHTSVREDK